MTSTTLWMGDVEPYWDENFIRSAFSASGETPTAVKMMKNRATGTQARYCFVDFANAATSERVVMTMNGKPVPNSSPPRLFKLNFAVFGMNAPPKPPGSVGMGGDRAGGLYGGRKEFSLFIGELTPEVEDHALYTFFSRRYPSIKGAKVIMDNTGISRGFGFVRFGSEEEHQTALSEMQGITGLGGRALRVSVATPKKPRAPEGGDTWSSGVGSWGSGGGGGASGNTWNPDAGNSWNSGSAGGGGGSWNSGNQYGGGSQGGWGSQGNYQGNWESGNTWGGSGGGQQQQSSWGGSSAGGSTGGQQNSWTGGQQGGWAGQDTWGGSGGNQGSWTGGQQYNQYQGYQQGQY